MPGCELLSVAEMAEADRLAIASGQAGLQLMERAGRAVAAEAMRLLGSPAAIFVACGAGNNGRDGFVAATSLRQHGYRVRLGHMGSSAGLKGDAAAMAARWGEAPEPLVADAIGGAGDLIIDALFGAGLSRPLDGDAAQIVAAVNASGKIVLAVDVPSGLNGSTGLVEGASIAATRTVTFFRLKP